MRANSLFPFNSTPQFPVPNTPFLACFCKEICWFIFLAMPSKPSANFPVVCSDRESYPVGLHTSSFGQPTRGYPYLATALVVQSLKPSVSGCGYSHDLPSVARDVFKLGVTVPALTKALKRCFRAFNAKVVCYLSTNDDCSRATVRKFHCS
jgi:hypothetical protein